MSTKIVSNSQPLFDHLPPTFGSGLSCRSYASSACPNWAGLAWNVLIVFSLFESTRYEKPPPWSSIPCCFGEMQGKPTEQKKGIYGFFRFFFFWGGGVFMVCLWFWRKVFMICLCFISGLFVVFGGGSLWFVYAYFGGCLWFVYGLGGRKP